LLLKEKKRIDYLVVFRVVRISAAADTVLDSVVGSLGMVFELLRF